MISQHNPFFVSPCAYDELKCRIYMQPMYLLHKILWSSFFTSSDGFFYFINLTFPTLLHHVEYLSFLKQLLTHQIPFFCLNFYNPFHHFLPNNTRRNIEFQNMDDHNLLFKGSVHTTKYNKNILPQVQCYFNIHIKEKMDKFTLHRTHQLKLIEINYIYIHNVFGRYVLTRNLVENN